MPITTEDPTYEPLQGCITGAAISVPDQFIEAIRKGSSIARAEEATTNALHDSGVVALPNDFQTHDLEKFQNTRRRQRGTFSTPFVTDFAQYTQALADEGATVFVDATDMTARAVLDLGTTDSPGHADHMARLQPIKTAAYAALGKIAGQALSQRAVAEFFEDWCDLAKMSFFNDQNGQDGTITRAQAIVAVRDITIDGARKLESTEQTLSATRTAFESVQASSRHTLPTLVYFKTRPYADLNERLFVLRMSISTSDSKPLLTLRVQNVEQHTEEMGNELAALVRDAIGGELPVLLGTYAKGQ